MKDEVHPNILSWHPSKKILASGWSNGEICIWNEQEKEVYEAPIFHKSAVTNVHWNGTGSRLITADEVTFYVLTSFMFYSTFDFKK